MKENENTNKKSRHHISPLALKLIFSAVAFGALLCFIITYMGYAHFTKVFANQYNRMTSQFAYIASSYTSGSQILKYGKTQIRDENYKIINDKLIEITNIADLDSISITIPDMIKYETQKYIFQTINASFVDTVHSYRLGDSEYLLDKPRESIINMKRLMLLGRLYSQYSFTEKDGHKSGAVTTAVPIRDEYNNIVAMLSVTKSIDEVILVQALYFKRISLVALSVTILFILIYALSLWRTIIRPVLMIRNETAYFAANNALSGLLKKIKRRDEIGGLATTFEDMTEKINRYITELTTVTAEKERISTELNVATKIQSDMLPQGYPPFPERKDFDLYATMSPAKEVGGDLYDYLLLDDDHLMLVVGDVSGKGVPAALFMVIAKTLLSSHGAQGLSPKEIFETTNNQLCKGNETGLFVTCWLGILTFSTGELRFVNAGHPYPVVYRKESDEFSYLKTHPNFVLAGMDDLPYKEHSITLNRGDRIFVYSDGVTEATDAKEELFGEDRLLAAMNGTQSMNAPDTLKAVRAAIDEFVGEAEQFDDITMLDFIFSENI